MESRIEQALEKYGAKTVMRMAEALKGTALAKKIFYKVEDHQKGPSLTISFPKYGEYVDQGRYPWGRGSIKDPRNKWNRFPPPDAIAAWAKAKGIGQFRDSKGRYVSSSTRTFLISRSIAAKGIKPRPFIYLFYKELNDLYHEIGKAAAADLALGLQKAFDDAGMGD
jgi:hypothetical protein